MGRTRSIAIVLAAAALLAACGSGGKVDTAAPRKLPIAVGSAATDEGKASGAASTAMMPYENRHYVAGDGLPALTGPAAAYELGTIDRDRAAELATRLGLGELRDENGTWTATDGTRRLDVSPSGQWSYGSGNAGVGVAVSPDGTPDTTVPPQPSPADVRRVAGEFLAKAGIDVGDADITVEGTYWRAAPKVDGVVGEGYGAYVGVTYDATSVEFAGGWLSTPHEVGDYERIGVAQAVRLLDEGKGHVGPQPMMAVAEDTVSSSAKAAVEPAQEPTTTAGSATEPAPPPATETTVCPPDAKCAEPAPPSTVCPGPSPETTITMPPPQEVTITITDAEAVLLLAPSWDGKTAYLVPGYRLHDDRGGIDLVLAISEDLIQPPPSTTTPPGSGKSEPGSSGSGSSGSSGGAVAPAEPSPVERPPTTDVTPCP